MTESTANPIKTVIIEDRNDNGIAGIEILKEKYPNMLILMLTVYDDERIFDALCAGANGYLLYHAALSRLKRRLATLLVL